MRRLKRTATLILIVFLLVACGGGEPTGGGGKGRSTPQDPPADPKDPTPAEPARDVVAEIEALPAGDLALLIDQVASAGGVKQGAIDDSVDR